MGLLLMGIIKQNAELKEGYRRKNRGYTKVNELSINMASKLIILELFSGP